MVKGVVKFYDKLKGFGFLKRDDNERDCYVNKMDLPAGVDLNDGDVVEFDVEAGKKVQKQRMLKE